VKYHRKTSLPGAALALFVFYAAGCAVAAADEISGAAPASAWAQGLAQVLDSPPLSRTKVSALVVRQSDGRVLFARHPDRELIPASNMKVLTALAALSVFGPAHRFETRVLSDRAPDPDGGVGTLYVGGSGDPALNSEDWWLLAASLRAKGLRRIEGDIVLDDGAFDRERWHAKWGKVGSRAYHAPVGGLTANYGAFGLTVRAGRAVGEPAVVAIDPPVDYLLLENRTNTVAANRRMKLAVVRSREGARNKIAVSGTMPLAHEEETFWRSVTDPTLYAGSVFAMQLAALGIEWTGSLRVAPVPEDAIPVFVYEGRPLAQIVGLFMKHSNNAVAESLVKALGREATGQPGAWKAGIARMRGELATLGIPLGGTRIVDGSGLARENLLSARTLVAALRIGQRSFEVGPEFVASLPIAARDGTLEKRAERSQDRVRAKTGLLTGATALSGFARLAGSDEPAVFAILANGQGADSQQARDALDSFAAAISSPER